VLCILSNSLQCLVSGNYANSVYDTIWKSSKVKARDCLNMRDKWRHSMWYSWIESIKFWIEMFQFYLTATLEICTFCSCYKGSTCLYIWLTEYTEEIIEGQTYQCYKYTMMKKIAGFKISGTECSFKCWQIIIMLINNGTGNTTFIHMLV
jgi:hypothetical protein